MKCIREASHGVSHGWIRVCGPTPPCRPQAGGGAEARAQRAGGEPACLAWGCRQIKGGQSAQEAGRARAPPHSVWHPTGLLVPLSPSCPVRTPVGWRVGLRVGLVGNPPWRPGLLFLPASPTPLAPPPVGTSMPVGAAKPSQAKPSQASLLAGLDVPHQRADPGNVPAPPGSPGCQPPPSSPGVPQAGRGI